MTDHRLEEVRLDDVIGVDDREHADVAGQAAGRLVERTRFVSRPGLEMNKLKTRAEFLAELLQRSPGLLVLGVVIDDLDDDVGISKLGQRSQRLAHHLDWFVVAGDLDGDLRSIGRIGHVRHPGAAAEDIENLEDVIDAQRQGS